MLIRHYEKDKRIQYHQYINNDFKITVIRYRENEYRFDRNQLILLQELVSNFYSWKLPS